MTPPTPKSAQFAWDDHDTPVISSTEPFSEVVTKLVEYISKAIDTAYSYEQLRTTVVGQSLRPLVLDLSENCHHPAIVAALLAARYVFGTTDQEDPPLGESRALACELVAWQYLTFLSRHELIDSLLHEVNPEMKGDDSATGNIGSENRDATESSPLLGSAHRESSNTVRRLNRPATSRSQRRTSLWPRVNTRMACLNITDSMAGMNALEIAAVADAKKFISQRPVQHIIEDIWNGDIIFWETLSTHATKKAKMYNKRTADPFSRLRVPKYQKAFQVTFFAAFLVLYYAVLVERNPSKVTPIEIALYIWIAAFAYDEFGEIRDAGFLFYQTDFWSIWDLGIILVGVAFFIMRVVGLTKRSDYLNDVAFDTLSLAALFLVPRICSVASLNPYFGSLLPVLKEMTTAFCKFLPVIVILYLGFLTTFTMLARDRLTINEVSWLLVKVFFGSSYLGFDVAVQISPIFGYTLISGVIAAIKVEDNCCNLWLTAQLTPLKCMRFEVIFVALTNILLLTALVSLVSNSLSEILSRAKEEYEFQYSVYVLESCTSRRLTYFLPPTNLIPLLLIRPLRLVMGSEKVRSIRVLLLKCVSTPFVALIWLYEGSCRILLRNDPQVAGARSGFSATTQPSAGLSRSGTTTSGLALGSSSRSTRVFGRDSRPSSVLDTDSADLMALVRKLSTQVDDLTALVAAQKNT